MEYRPVLVANQLDLGDQGSALVYLFVLVAVGSGLLQKHTIHHRNLRSEMAAVSALDHKCTLVRRASGQRVISKQPNRPIPWITICLAEGWSIPFQPQQHRFPADLVTRVAIDGRLFNVVLHGVSNYHPRAPHIVRGFNVPWEVIEKSGEVNATAIVHRAAPTPATNAQTIANFESETSAPLARIEDSTGIEEAQHVAQVPVVNSPPPSRCASPGFTFEHEAPVTEAAVGLPPNARFGASYPDTIQSFNRPLGTNQYIAWLHLTRPTQPLPNRAVPADQAAVVRSHWRPVLRGLADRAEDRHLPSRATIAAESEEGHVMAEEAGPSTVVEDQPEISTLEEGSSGNGQ
ncbi:hypothetical protein FRC00_000651 [Tulasnella sp. 408]|nr:hypothetical protein FRC00_000651 [Tulasnella sp. 408]